MHCTFPLRTGFPNDTAVKEIIAGGSSASGGMQLLLRLSARKADEAGLSGNGDYERLHTVADRVFEADFSDMEADALAGRGEFGRFFGDLTLALTQN